MSRTASKFSLDNLKTDLLTPLLLNHDRYVRETFSWRWYYWYLTDEGLEYLREYLHLPAEIVPDTLKKQAAKPARAPGSGAEGREDGRGGGYGGDRGRREGGYRREGGEGGFGRGGR